MPDQREPYPPPGIRLQAPPLRAGIAARLVAVLLGVLLSACAGPQIYSTTQVGEIKLTALELKLGGLAFMTPSSTTGQEEDKQALALTFTEVLKRLRPDLRVIPLPETLSAINNEGLAKDYRSMFEDYRLTGIFERELLESVARVAGVRYLAQLKLGGFRQESKNRWGTLGLRILETKSTTLRLFLQIWDSRDGSVAWEGAQEMTFSHDSIAEDTATFKGAVEQSARDLVSHLP